MLNSTGMAFRSCITIYIDQKGACTDFHAAYMKALSEACYAAKKVQASMADHDAGRLPT